MLIIDEKVGYHEGRLAVYDARNVSSVEGYNMKLEPIVDIITKDHITLTDHESSSDDLIMYLNL